MERLTNLITRGIFAALAMMLTGSAASAETLMMPKRDALMGQQLVVWGVTTQASGAVTLDYGDGTPASVGTIGAIDRSYIAFPHTYATPGLKTATLTVGAETATVQIQVFDGGSLTAENLRSLRVNNAIQDGLRFLWTSQSNRAGNFPAGGTTNWGGSFSGADASLITAAFENHGYKLSGSAAPTGLYEKYVVRRGLNYVFSTLFQQNLGVQTAGNPCVGSGVAAGTAAAWNGADCIGISAPGDPGYATGVAIIAIAASGTPNRIQTEVGGITNNKTYAEIIQRLVNAEAWGQSDANCGAGRGGFGYQHNGCQFDGSTAGWAILGFLDGEASGATIPAFVRSEMAIGLNNAINTDGSFDYCADGSPNNQCSPGPAKVGIGLQGLYFINANATPAGVTTATVTNNISSWWQGSGIGGLNWNCSVTTGAPGTSQANKGCAYAMFNNFKGLKLKGISTLLGVPRAAGPGSIPANDWYADYQDWFLANQNAPTTTGGGQWPTMGFSCCYGNPQALTAGIAELILSPVALVLPDEDKFSTVGLTPPTNTANVGTSHTVTAHAESASGAAVPGATVNFTILTGPHAGLTGTGTTNGSGNATFTYTGTNYGLDTIRASIGTLSSNTVEAKWIAPTTTVVVCPPSVFYNGAPQEPCTATASDAFGFSVAAAVTYTDNLNAGTATANASYAGDEFHTGSNGSATFEILPVATVTTVTCPPSVVYDGTPQTPCVATATGPGVNESLAVSYTANVNVGTVTASASYAGDINHLASSDSETFEIVPAPSVTVVTCPANVVYNGAAQEVCSALVTGAGGLNQVLPISYLDNVNAGTASAKASFAGDANHAPSDDAETFEILPAPSVTVVTCPPSVIYNGAAQTVCAASVTGVGGLNQVLPVSYTDNVNVGTATASASYAGDSNHAPSSDSATFAITPAPSVTVISCPVSVVYNGAAQEVCTASVTGVGGLNALVPVTYSDNVNVGTATASATFGGDANHSGSSASATFEITQAPTSTAVSAPTVTYSVDGVVTVTVSSSVGTVGGNVTLTVDGGAPLAAPLVGGSAVFTLSSPDAGDHALVATYAAQGNFLGSSAVGNLHVNPSPTATSLAISPAAPTPQGTAVTLTATVTSVASGSGTPNGTVTFTNGTTVLGTATVNGSGVAVLTTTALPIGPASITATYNGTNNYLTSASAAVSHLVFGWGTGTGTFVIGNLNANLGQAVTYWGAQWAKVNALSGGSAPSSFKGFAASIAPAPAAAVGKTWTSRPGASNPNEPTSVPAYLGLIVASSVTKSGSTEAGNIVKIVVVQTAPGYGNAPGHTGTGTIVAVLP